MSLASRINELNETRYQRTRTHSEVIPAKLGDSYDRFSKVAAQKLEAGLGQVLGRYRISEDEIQKSD